MTETQSDDDDPPLKRVALELGYNLPDLVRALNKEAGQELPPTTIQYWWGDRRNKHQVVPHDKPWREPLRAVLLRKGMTPSQENELFGNLSPQSTRRGHHITAPLEDRSPILKQARVKINSTLERGEPKGMNSLAMRIIHLENMVQQLTEEMADLRLTLSKREKSRRRP